MNSELTIRSDKEVDEDRAAVLLGLTRAQIGLLCEKSGLGRQSADSGSAQRWFTYHELYRLCCCAARP